MWVKIEDGKMFVKSNYCSKFNSRAKTLQGKWDGSCWVFPAENEPYVRKLLMEIYGEDGTPQKRVTVDLDLDEYSDEDTYDGEIYIGDISIARRWERDYRVLLASNIMVVEGEFYSSGGSRNYPEVTWEEGTVLRVKNIPIGLYNQIEHKDGVSVVDEPPERKSNLIEEKESLERRLAEVNEALKKLEEDCSEAKQVETVEQEPDEE